MAARSRACSQRAKGNLNLSTYAAEFVVAKRNVTKAIWFDRRGETEEHEAARAP
jgi:hypothetical protein